MNKNIFIGILVVIIIALGGYAIWKTATPAPIIQINGSQPTLNQTSPTPLLNNNASQQQTLSSTPACSPSITVLSPNGGETYTIGQKVTIKWNSCNFSPSDKVILNLGNDADTAHCASLGHPVGCWGSSGIGVTTNTGSYIWDTSLKMFGDGGPNTVPVTAGNNIYRISLSIYSASQSKVSATDSSDKPFTIKASQQSTANYTNDAYHFKLNLPNGLSVTNANQTSNGTSFYVATSLANGASRLHDIDITNTSCQSSSNSTSATFNGVSFLKTTGTGAYGGMESGSIDASYCILHNNQSYTLSFTEQYNRVDPNVQQPDPTATYQTFDQQMQNLNFAFTN